MNDKPSTGIFRQRTVLTVKLVARNSPVDAEYEQTLLAALYPLASESRGAAQGHSLEEHVYALEFPSNRTAEEWMPALLRAIEAVGYRHGQVILLEKRVYEKSCWPNCFVLRLYPEHDTQWENRPAAAREGLLPSRDRRFSLSAALLATVTAALSLGLLDSQLPIAGLATLAGVGFGAFWALIHGRQAILEGLVCGVLLGLLTGLLIGLGRGD